MSKQLIGEAPIPTITYDVSLGDTVDYIELNSESIASRLLTLGLSVGEVEATEIFISSALKEESPEQIPVLGFTRGRRIEIYIGSFIKLLPYITNQKIDAIVSLMISTTIVHELTHRVQYANNEIPEFTFADQGALEDENMPWEIDARRAEIDYANELKKRNVGAYALLSLRAKGLRLPDTV